MTAIDLAPKRLGRALSGRGQHGFTMIEVMITVAITAALTTIAYSNYRSYLINARRSAASACLLERAQFMERYYTRHLSYLNAPSPASCDPDVARFYTISFSDPPVAKQYQLQAAPQGTQLEDRECATLILNAQGVRGSSGYAEDVTACW